LCGGDPPSFTFKKLKQLRLSGMPNFGAWWETNEMQGQDDPVFPEVEKLSISSCERLATLPRASVIRDSPGGMVNPVWRSAFPALKELGLFHLTNFQRWEEVAGTPGEQITTFPWLEELLIRKCPELITLPETPRLSVLDIRGGSQQICLRAVRHITSLSKLVLKAHKREAELLVVDDDKEKWNLESSSSSLRVIALKRCGFLLAHSSAPMLWNGFVQLEDLTISNLDALVHWPENVFRCLASLRKLKIGWCKNLTGRKQQEASSEQSTTRSSCVLPPRLEFLLLQGCESLGEVPTLPESLRELYIRKCDSLVEVPTLPASLKQLHIHLCRSLESVVVRKEEKSCSSEPMPPLPIPNLSLFIECANLRSLLVQLDCTDLGIYGCASLTSLDYGDKLRSLENLILVRCFSLESIPDVPQAYSSLTYLEILECHRLNVLPPCLKQRLNDIKDKDLDDRYTGNEDTPVSSSTIFLLF
jgi:hypothetical protein